MSTNHTPNYQLSQWEKPDKVRMEDFNADNAKLDAALKAEADARAALAAQVAKCGSCQTRIDSYVGSGEFGIDKTRSITYPHPPQLVIFLGPGSSPFSIVPRGASGAVPFGYNQYTSVGTTWKGNTLTWFSSHDAESSYNVKDRKYYVVAFLAADQ